LNEALPARKRWSLNQQAFDALLARLASDRETAGRKFESLRRRLLQYFSYESCVFPDKWADETLDRVAKRISEGAPIDDVDVFTRGVARMVLREARLAENRDRNLTELPVPDPSGDERDAACLDDCTAALSPAARDLVLQYFLGTCSSRPAARKALAAKLGIEMDALRSRALRARRQLEACVRECREKQQRDAINGDESPFKVEDSSPL
jgi:DNA-directed RNA polymerase specialized sigma24 family protein